MSFDREAGKSRIVSSDALKESLGKVVCAIGVFDGVHIGHRRLIADCCSEARQLGVDAVILTFDIDPEELFAKDSPRKLLSNAKRIEMLADLGADVVLVQRFDRDFSQIEAHDFAATALKPCMEPVSLFVGSNFRFGCGAKGDVELLRREFIDASCFVRGEDLFECEGVPVTATRIRDLIETGDIARAGMMLGRMHGFEALVVHGREIGRTLGYPTANLVPTFDAVKPADGVYAGYARVQGTWFAASISVGIPKTFGDIASTIEAHLIDFDEDIYDQRIDVCFARRLRPMIKFDSAEQLKAQIAADTAEAAALPSLS